MGLAVHDCFLFHPCIPFMSGKTEDWHFFPDGVVVSFKFPKNESLWVTIRCIKTFISVFVCAEMRLSVSEKCEVVKMSLPLCPLVVGNQTSLVFSTLVCP